MRGSAAVVGVGELKPARYTDGETTLGLMTKVALAAIDDAGLELADIDGVLNFMGTGPSYFDLNKDGQTDAEDLAIAQVNLGMDCLGACRRADLDGDNHVTKLDADLLRSAFGACDSDLASDHLLCAADLDGDGLVGLDDLVTVLDAWGNKGGPEDLDGSGTVDFGDLLIVLDSWGPCKGRNLEDSP